MADPEQQATARAKLGATRALGVAWLACCVLVACLNPMPEEFPSSDDDRAPSLIVEVVPDAPVASPGPNANGAQSGNDGAASGGMATEDDDDLVDARDAGVDAGLTGTVDPDVDGRTDP